MQHISIPKPMDAGNSPSYAEKTGILFQQPQKNRNLLANSKNPSRIFSLKTIRKSI